MLLSEGSQRLLAFLALKERPVKRLVIANALWPEVTEGRASANLRSAVLRLCRVACGALDVNPQFLSLPTCVSVDVHESRAVAHQLLGAGSAALAAHLDPEAIVALSADLLPGWYDDWVLLEAEDWRQLRLHSLEALATLLTEVGRYGDAVAAARAAVRADPLRESSCAVSMRVFLAEGNRSEAVREFERYRVVLRAELGLEPTEALRQLMRQVRGIVTPG